MSRAVIRRIGVLSALMLAALAGGWSIGRHWLPGLSPARSLDDARRAAFSGEADGVASFRARLAESPDDALRVELAEFLGRTDPLTALEELRRIEPGSKQWPRAARLVAAYNLKLGRDYDARPPLEALAGASPGDAGVHLSLAEIAFRGAGYESALEEARRVDPTSPEVDLLIAECLDNLGRPAEMIAPLRRALELDPELLPAHLNLAYALEKGGRPKEALPHVERFLATIPESVQGNKLLAMIQWSQGEREEALSSIRRSRRTEPSNVSLAILEAEILLDLRRGKEAFDLLAPFDGGWGYEPRFLKVFAAAARSSPRAGDQAEAERLERRLADVRTTASLSSAEPDTAT